MVHLKIYHVLDATSYLLDCWYFTQFQINCKSEVANVIDCLTAPRSTRSLLPVSVMPE